MARPGLEPRASRLPSAHSAKRAIQSHGRPFTFHPAQLDSSPNLLGTTEEQRNMHFLVVLALAAPTLATKCRRGGKNRGPTGTRTQGLSLTVRALPTELPSHIVVHDIYGCLSACMIDILYPFSVQFFIHSRLITCKYSRTSMARTPLGP